SGFFFIALWRGTTSPLSFSTRRPRSSRSAFGAISSCASPKEPSGRWTRRLRPALSSGWVCIRRGCGRYSRARTTCRETTKRSPIALSRFSWEGSAMRAAPAPKSPRGINPFRSPRRGWSASKDVDPKRDRPMKSIRLRTAFLALLLGLSMLGAGCGRKAIENAQAESKERTPEIFEVGVAPVVERTATRNIEVVGSLEAQDNVTISAQAAGILEEISVDVGSQVRQGQTIAHVDARELKLKTMLAEATLRQAEARLGMSGDGKFDPERTAEVRQARAGLERARYD